MSTSTNTSSRRRLSGPLIIGLVAGALGVALALVGIARGNVPLNVTSVGLAILISGVSWGLVAWAIATAARDVESDIAEAEASEAATGGTE